jgi:hypothetical protein
LETGDLTHPTSGLVKPGEGLARVLTEDEKRRVGKMGEGVDFWRIIL